MRGVCADVLGARLGQCAVALDERRPRLHQVVYYHDVAAACVPLLDGHKALVALAHLGADNLGVALEAEVEALPGTLIGVSNRDLSIVGKDGRRGTLSAGRLAAQAEGLGLTQALTGFGSRP